MFHRNTVRWITLLAGKPCRARAGAATPRPAARRRARGRSRPPHRRPNRRRLWRTAPPLPIAMPMPATSIMVRSLSLSPIATVSASGTPMVAAAKRSPSPLLPGTRSPSVTPSRRACSRAAGADQHQMAVALRGANRADGRLRDALVFADQCAVDVKEQHACHGDAPSHWTMMAACDDMQNPAGVQGTGGIRVYSSSPLVAMTCWYQPKDFLRLRLYEPWPSSSPST